jgi:hypothetical protein
MNCRNGKKKVIFQFLVTPVVVLLAFGASFTVVGIGQLLALAR